MHRFLRAAFTSAGYRPSQVDSHARGTAAALDRPFDLLVVEVLGIG